MFRAPHDYRTFLELLGDASSRCCVEIHGYVLMTTHIHLIATPLSAASLPQMMKRVGENYVRSFNRHYERTGTLCEGRYRGSLIQDEKYWLTCLRYIELNPVRAGLVPSPDLYEWSSYRAHAYERQDSLVTSHPLFLALGRSSVDRQHAWQATCGAPVDEDTLITIRRAINSCRPLKDGLAKAEPAQAAVQTLD
jgi:putative transposase